MFVPATIAYSTACLLLGVSLVLALIFAIASRYSRSGDGTGCMGTVLCALTLCASIYFFIMAVQMA